MGFIDRIKGIFASKDKEPKELPEEEGEEESVCVLCERPGATKFLKDGNSGQRHPVHRACRRRLKKDVQNGRIYA